MCLLGERQRQNTGLLWKELEERWSEQEPGREGEDNTLLWDQFLLCDGPLKQELQQQVHRQTSLTFRQQTLEPPACPEVDLEQWKEEVKQELCQELQDQLTARGRTLVTELRQQCAPGPIAPLPPGGTEAQGAVFNQRYAPLSKLHSFSYQWDERGRPICCNPRLW
ncbi:hypothetical protein SKAU_G00282410 [Synaphobranchus kaupii]|uniref:Uncharacterized protein n=1 Tax=Synaphobranchus kaupii TaxID=118154 RepID=A0A9Q1IP32_SYNKA|nr:hypothetical protein SKAU_G00282410 [Synaphobranchus kaupii]